MELSDLLTTITKGSKILVKNIKKIKKEIDSYTSAKYVVGQEEIKIKRPLKKTIHVPTNITSDSSIFYELVDKNQENNGPFIEIKDFQDVENLTFRMHLINPFEKINKLGEPYALLMKNGSQYHYFVKGK